MWKLYFLAYVVALELREEVQKNLNTPSKSGELEH